MKPLTMFALVACVVTCSAATAQQQSSSSLPPGNTDRNDTMRVAAVQAQLRIIDWRIKQPADVLAAVDKNLAELERIVDDAGRKECDVLAFPEDTLGLLNWLGVNEAAHREVLPAAVARMLDRLGSAAAKHRMYLVVCSDHIEADGGVYNTAFLLGRDGKEIGRYHKTCPAWHERGARSRGDSFPVFPTADLGTVGMLICYDLVIPETARCLALQGADIIFFPTMGGAAVGDDDIEFQALRVRAAENHVYLVVAFRGGGAMIISPRGKVLARADGPDGLAVADIQPRGGREGGDAMNYQSDMRARLFRERNPEAFRILTDANPPALDNLPIDITAQECARIAARVLSVGEEEYRQAEALVRAGKIHDAITALENLQSTYRGSWIDRAAAERLHTLRGESGAMAWARIQPFFTPPPEYDNKLGDYRPVLRFDDSSPVNTPQDWPRRRAEILKYWHSVMGPWPPLVEKPGIVYEKQERVEDFTRHTVAIEVAPGRLVGPQYLLVPDGPGPFPAVLVTWYNSADSAGLNQEVRGTLDFGYQLAKRGFVALCVGGVNPPHPDLPDADRGGDGESRIQPLSYLAYVAANCCNALAHIPQVDAKRIGIVGHSFGGKWAMFASCLYERFSCAVWIDPGIVWNEQDPNANYWEKWYLGYQFDQPADQQRNEGVVTTDNPRTGAYKLLVEADHNLHELHALMAPRPFLVSGGAQDRPDHWTALNHAIGLNSFLGYSGRVAMTMRDGHTPTPESNAQVHDFLEFFLRE